MIDQVEAATRHFGKCILDEITFCQYWASLKHTNDNDSRNNNCSNITSCNANTINTTTNQLPSPYADDDRMSELIQAERCLTEYVLNLAIHTSPLKIIGKIIFTKDKTYYSNSNKKDYY